MIKKIISILTLFVVACGGTSESEINVNNQTEAVGVTTFQCFVRKGTTFPADPLRNPMSMSTNPNDMGGSIIQGIQINKAVAGAADSGKYTTSTGPRASISVQISEFDAIKDFVNSAAAAGRQVVMSFTIQNTDQRVTSWPTVGPPTWALRGISPVTIFMNVFPGRRANTDPAVCCFSVDSDVGSSPGYENTTIKRFPGFYEGIDFFTPAFRTATVNLNDTGWNHMVSVLNDPTHNARIQVTYESAVSTNDKPLLGLPIFSLR